MSSVSSLHIRKNATSPSLSLTLVQPLQSSPLPITHLRSLGRKAKLWRRSAAEHDELALEEDVTVDREPDARITLDTTKALRARRVGRRVVDVAAGHDGAVGADAERDAGQRGAAGKDVTTVRRRVGGAGHLAVVGGDDGGGEVEERGAGVGDGVDAAAGEGAGADGVSVAGEFPEAVAGVDVYVGDGAGVLGGVDEAKVVGSRGALLQVGGEDG